MRCTRLLLSFSLLCLCSLHLAAQDSDYVYKDSSLIVADSVAADEQAAAVTKQAAVANTSEADSIANVNKLASMNDSAEGLKHLKSFAYAKNLDSMLMALQKEEQGQKQQPAMDSSDGSSFFLSSITKIFFWTAGCFFVGFILYKLFFTKGIFQRSVKLDKVTVAADEKETLSVNTDYNKLIGQAIADKNYRLAIRFHYLQTLQKLNARHAIQFTLDKTNFQYVRELTGKPYRDSFAALTRNYEYAWYGGFEIDEDLFTAIQNNFKQFNNLV